MKNFKKTLALLIFLGFPAILSAQDNAPDGFFQEDEPTVRLFRIGAKIGFPNLIGGNLEYVTPLLNKKLAISADYSTIKSDWILELMGEEPSDSEDPTNLTYSYIEGGLNYYFFRPGRGLYGGVSYGILKIDGMLYDAFTNDNDSSGDGNVDFSHSSINVKLGAKLGGLFYFRPEVGYSFTPLPSSYEMEVEYEDGTRENHLEEFDTEVSPTNLLFKGFMLNIGLGFAF